MESILKVNDLTKRFPGVLANDEVSLEIEKGEIHALLGENGAGKSTLMNCLYGLLLPDSGEIYFKGEKVAINSCDEAIELGIGMVHQHFMLVQELTVVENVILGLDRSKWLELDSAAREVKKLSDRYNFNLDPFEKVENLPVGMQQRVEILKVLYREPELLIFDEPTAVLTPNEVEEFFKVVKQLSDEGKTILFISHKLNEVMYISDKITVLRDGKVIGCVNTDQTDENELAQMMVGREVFLDFNPDSTEVGETVLKVDNLHVKSKSGYEAVDGLSFEVRRGEIFGVAGVDGNGQTELSDAIAGLIPVQKGKISINNSNTVGLSPDKLLEKGVSYIPPDRQEVGLVLDFTLKENIVIKEFIMKPFSNKYGVLNNTEIKNYAENLIEKYDIRATGSHTLCKQLSGGNQQKVILARELNRDPDLLIAVHPTRGLDVGAIEFVREQLIEQRNRGAAVLLISTELEEIMSLSDRIGVIYEGQFTGKVNPGKVDKTEIGLMMAGKKRLDESQQEG